MFIVKSAFYRFYFTMILVKLKRIFYLCQCLFNERRFDYKEDCGTIWKILGEMIFLFPMPIYIIFTFLTYRRSRLFPKRGYLLLYSGGVQARLQGRASKWSFATSLLNTKANIFAVAYENFCYTKIWVVLTQD